MGARNPQLIDENFVDRNLKKISDQNKLSAIVDEPTDLSEEEAKINR